MRQQLNQEDQQSLQETKPEEPALPTTPTTPIICSSPFATLLTIRKFQNVGDRVIGIANKLSPSSEQNIRQFMKGALVQGTQLLQVRRDLRQTHLAEQTRKYEKQQKKEFYRVVIFSRLQRDGQ